jgi:hypothetical protein
LNNITGPIVVEGNRLIGSSQVGIMLAMNDPAYTVNLRDNEIRQNAVVTNGYAILLSAVQNFTIAGNTIQPTSGKGIDLDGYNGNLLGHGEVHDNHVDVRERVNREYPTGLEAVALRIRNNVDDMGPHRDIRVHDNVFIARTGPGLVSQAYGARISYANVGGAMNDAGIALEDNTIVAVVETTNTSFRAKALVLDRIDAGIGLRIRGNVLESNDISLALTDTGGSVHQVDLVSTTLRRSAEGAARPYTAVLAGYYNRQIADVRLLDTRLENGATDAIVWAGTGVKDLSVGWLLTVTAQDPVGAALPSAAVSVSDKSGVEVFSGTTGADGSVRDIPVVTTVFRQETTNPRIITTDHRGPHRVEASHGGGSAISTVDLDSSMVLILTVE